MEVNVMLGWILVAELVMVIGLDCISKIKWFRSRRVFNAAIPAGQHKREIIHSWHVLLDATVLYLFVHVGLLRLAVFSWTDTSITALILAVWVEIFLLRTPGHAFLQGATAYPS